MILFVGSCIGYASDVLAPRTIGSITKMESLQHRATKFILNMHQLAGGYFVSDYQERLSCLNVLSLTSGMK